MTSKRVGPTRGKPSTPIDDGLRGRLRVRMVMSADEPHRFLIDDHDSIYSEEVDRTIVAMCLTILRTPVRTPQANANG